ncbi:phosphatase [Rhodospirillaceae bacterium RKSG073]|nr:phosphatase [Curvivirga aplysinae]
MAKGRRFGFTHGVSNWTIDAEMIGRSQRILWGDTVSANIKRYIERYWMPTLRQLPPDMWKWDKTDNKVMIGDSVCDFRSADKPENWEGFGYDLVILNEAGIILKNPYLWANAVRPMLLDNPKSRAIIGGAPKGKNQFYELCQQEQAGVKDWKHFSFTTYDNPLLSKEAIDDLKVELRRLGGDKYVDQEIYAKFLDGTENQYIEDEFITEAFARKHPSGTYDNAVRIAGVDLAMSRDRNVIYHRQGDETKMIKVLHPSGTNWTKQIATIIVETCIKSFKADMVFIDAAEAGGGAGVIDLLTEWGYRDVIRGVKFGEQATESTLFKNKRAEMYSKARSWIGENGSLPEDSEYKEDLKRDLRSIAYMAGAGDRLQLIPKDQLEQSPDIADALSLTFAYPVKKKVESVNSWLSESGSGGSWMGS